ncbi:MAG: lysophospholipid acyltransferase family protein [Chitinophagaceae bacterium]
MYYIIYGLLYFFSLMPWFIMYGISDLLAFLTYYIFGYRKKVVLSNLSIAFPEKSAAERKQIAKEFYRNFFDTLAETIKMIFASDQQLSARFLPKEEMLEKMRVFVRQGKNVQIQAMHNFNWEIVNLGVAKSIGIPFSGVYMPLSNKHLEKIFCKMRSRYGTILVPATTFKKSFLKFEKESIKENYSIALVADQSPGSPLNAWWVNFFNKPTPFVTGPEKAARQRSLPVVFANFYKIKRGVYTFDVKVFTENAANTKEGELTLAYVKYVEDCIRQRPDNYLWSHRRWKHTYKAEYINQALEPLNT